MASCLHKVLGCNTSVCAKSHKERCDPQIPQLSLWPKAFCWTCAQAARATVGYRILQDGMAQLYLRRHPNYGGFVGIISNSSKRLFTAVQQAAGSSTPFWLKPSLARNKVFLPSKAHGKPKRTCAQTARATAGYRILQDGMAQLYLRRHKLLYTTGLRVCSGVFERPSKHSIR